jgi:hypothetical protein
MLKIDTAAETVAAVHVALGNVGSANEFGGFDYPTRTGRVIRVYLDDNQVNLLPMRNGGSDGPHATFTHMPSAVVVAAVLALLRIERAA